MADWRVSREIIEILPFPKQGVEKLELARLGSRQAVVEKGRFKSGDIVIFAPEKSLLPDLIADEGDRRKYLSGSLKNRVKSVRLQGEISEGLFLDDNPEFADVPLGEDISDRLGIQKYEPPVPAQMAGQLHSPMLGGKILNRHDVEQAGVNLPEFTEGEEVFAFEKIHGSSCAFIQLPGGDGTSQILVSSKGLLGKQLFLREDEKNIYWKAIREVDLIGKIKDLYPDKFIQVFGEVFPCQFLTYGKTKPTLLLFRLEVDGNIVAYDDVPLILKKIWVPLLYRGPFNMDVLRTTAKGAEQVSGKALHIKEGIVVSPIQPRMSRFSKHPFPLYVKIINPKYAEKETGEELG